MQVVMPTPNIFELIEKAKSKEKYQDKKETKRQEGESIFHYMKRIIDESPDKYKLFIRY